MKKILKYLSVFIVTICIVVGGCLYYAFKIEPFSIKKHEFELNKTENTSKTLRVVQFSDTHIKKDFTAKNLVKIVDNINELNPDVIIFSGDLYDNYAIYNDDEAVIEVLSTLKAKHAKIAVWGNRDIGGGAIRSYAQIMKNAGFSLLKNEEFALKVNNKNISFYGLDDHLIGAPNIANISSDIKYDYSFFLSHEGDVVDEYSNIGFNMALSGHSHGGQIDIPFVPKISTELGDKYLKGMYSISNKMQLYVNSGIGTTRISARFRVAPEISVFDLYL